MTILTHLKTIPPRFLKQLSANKNQYDVKIKIVFDQITIFQACPVEVKRQIWELQDEIFKEEIHGILFDYIQSCDLYYAGYEMTYETNIPPTKRYYNLKIILTNLAAKMIPGYKN